MEHSILQEATSRDGLYFIWKQRFSCCAFVNVYAVQNSVSISGFKFSNYLVFRYYFAHIFENAFIYDIDALSDGYGREWKFLILWFEISESSPERV